MAVSCDSFNEEINKAIGRGTGTHLTVVRHLANQCHKRGIKFKLNTVVNRHNVGEDMSSQITSLNPSRWKCFQVLSVTGENDSEKTLRNVNPMLISDEEFRGFCDRHKSVKVLVPENNSTMKSSYLLLDEKMCFLNQNVGQPTDSILDVGVQTAMEGVYWDKDAFIKRGGIFPWSKGTEEASGCGAANPDYEF